MINPTQWPARKTIKFSLFQFVVRWTEEIFARCTEIHSVRVYVSERKEATKKEREKKERKREGDREREVFQKRPAIYETEWKRVLEGARRPPPLIPPLNIAISTSQLHSAIPHFKGKISGRLSLHRLYDELASRTPARMENNATSCSWQLVPNPLFGNFLANYGNSRRSRAIVFFFVLKKIFDSSVRIFLFRKNLSKSFVRSWLKKSMNNVL